MLASRRGRARGGRRGVVLNPPVAETEPSQPRGYVAGAGHADGAVQALQCRELTRARGRGRHACTEKAASDPMSPVSGGRGVANRSRGRRGGGGIAMGCGTDVAAESQVAADGGGRRGRGRGGRSLTAASDVQREGPTVLQWLSRLDDNGGLLSQAYAEVLQSRFHFLREVVEAYVEPDGNVDERFFQDFGVTKIGHKRTFQKWFREFLSTSREQNLNNSHDVKS
eukprot:gnl/TRDRNA2_/TRDRNA2_148303_c0_seq1.p1 gnl/TRDRNA2_/TRDRNA2_148303_c0~~gnl/TRDRNA2_/TRDRNA2_148303_c0_seq1.p1  ORF type:complete len:225 (+),score=32.65 gnl/TRDRNA2_/TRDRNA2_148303_c0_seq1:2-676(+)